MPEPFRASPREFVYRCPTFATGPYGEGGRHPLEHDSHCGQRCVVIDGADHGNGGMADKIWMVRFGDGHEMLVFKGELRTVDGKPLPRRVSFVA
jgi:hypothetical protein